MMTTTMTNQQRAAMQMAYDLLCRPVDTIAEMYCFGMGDCDEARAELREALAQPQDNLMSGGYQPEKTFENPIPPPRYPNGCVNHQKELNYGKCPVCGANGIARERRLDGNDTCANGHSYKSSLAVKSQPDVKESLTAQTQGEDDLTIAYMVGYEKGKDYMKEKAAKVCEKEMQAWINFDEDCHEASAIKKCAAAIRSMK